MLNKKNIFKGIYYSAVFVLAFLASLITITSVLFIFNYKISYFNIPFAFFISCFVMFFYNYKKDTFAKLLAVIIAILFVFASVIVNSKYYDVSWDGNTYHKDAVGALKNGWNPLRQDYISFYKNSGYRDMEMIGNSIETAHGLWQSHYAKGAWYVDANFYYYLNNIESSKVFNLLATYICVILSFNFLFKILKKKLLSLIISGAFALSPVVMVQWFTFYNDGALYNILLCFLLELLLFIKEEKNIYLITSSLLIIVLCGIKFTGLAYGGVFGLFLFLSYLFLKFKSKNLLAIRKPIIVFTIVVIGSICISNIQPYLSNTYLKGNPFYPLAGENKVDIVSYNQPNAFNKLNTISKFGYSILSKTKNINQKSNDSIELKVPFLIYSDELNSLSRNDLRIGGFGPLFSGLFIISILIILANVISYICKKNYYALSILLPLIASCGLLILIISESWWARYTPYVYFLPLITMVLLSKNKSKFNQSLFIVFITIIYINLLLFFNNNLIYNYKESQKMRNTITEYQNLKKDIHLISDNEFLGLLYNFDDKNIKFNINNKCDSNKVEELFKFVRYCKE